MSSINVITTYDSRLTAIRIMTSIGPLLAVCVYMPVDTGDLESFECYVEVCSKSLLCM